MPSHHQFTTSIPQNTIRETSMLIKTLSSTSTLPSANGGCFSWKNNFNVDHKQPILSHGLIHSRTLNCLPILERAWSPCQQIMFEMIMLNGKKIKLKTGVMVCQLHKTGMWKKRPILCLCIPHSSSSREGGMAKLACSRQLLLLCTTHLAFLQWAAWYHPPYITNSIAYTATRKIST